PSWPGPRPDAHGRRRRSAPSIRVAEPRGTASATRLRAGWVKPRQKAAWPGSSCTRRDTCDSGWGWSTCALTAGPSGDVTRHPLEAVVHGGDGTARPPVRLEPASEARRARHPDGTADEAAARQPLRSSG